MFCEFIITRGKNKGNLCNIKTKKSIDNKYFCSRHIKKQDTNKENINSNDEISKIIKNMVDTIVSTNKEKSTNKELIKSSIPDIKGYNIPDIKGYEILEFISKGEFGSVYKIKNKKTNEISVMKISDDEKNSKLLFFEYTLLFNIFAEKRGIYFPELGDNCLKCYKKINKHTYLFLEYFNETLQDRMNKCQLDKDNIKYYGLQLLDIIEFIHNKRYLYIDFKPENIMFKDKISNDIKLIDFGSCQIYIAINGNHIKNKKLSNSIGTDLFSSIRMNNSQQPGRIDDIECIGYLLLYMYNNTLPWIDCESSNKILYKKRNITRQKIFNNSPEFIKKFITNTKNIKFNERPKYNEFRNLLK